MANLYEIDRQISECILTDEETGEVLGVDEERLAALQLERDTKIEQLALWYKNINSDIAAYEAEKKAFESKIKSAKSRAESLKRYLSDNLGGKAFKTTCAEIKFTFSQKVEVSDVYALPAEYQRFKDPEPDKVALKKALKSGAEIEGAVLVDSMNITIK